MFLLLTYLITRKTSYQILFRSKMRLQYMNSSNDFNEKYYRLYHDYLIKKFSSSKHLSICNNKNFTKSIYS